MVDVARPTGTVSFLFTDVEGSTSLWERHRDGMAAALGRHDELLRGSFAPAGGYVFSTAGDSFAVAFKSAGAALEAAVSAQCALRDEFWPSGIEVRVRMGLHAGTAQERDGDYFGPALNRAARLMGLAHGGQILLSGAAQELVRDNLGTGVDLVDLGKHALRGIERAEHVFEAVFDGGLLQFPPLRDGLERIGNLPLPATSFVGRVELVKRLAAGLATEQVVTLVGPGGVGKTRLAVEAAAEAADRFRDGVWMVELAPVTDPDAVVHAFGAVLSVRPQEGMDPLGALLDALTGRRLLLVVDNAEHLLLQTAELVRRIVAAAPEVSILATSREPLGVQGEWIWSVPPLDVALEAVQLFCERAQLADAAFDPSDQRDAIESLCTHLDGIPLAIELAAARVRSMTAQELVDRISDRFRLLRDARDGARTQRHQTLRAAVEWSHRLLNDAEQQFFERLSVFTGSFDAHAAMTVCAPPEADEFDVIEMLSELVDKSLVRAIATRGRTRYSLLETLRQFGLEHLVARDEIAALRAAHCHHYVAAAEQCQKAYEGTANDDGAATFVQDWDNFRSAFEWAEASDESDQAGRLVQATFWFCWFTIRDEHADWTERAARLGDPTPEVLAAASWWLRIGGDYDRAMSRAAQALERAGPGEHTRAALALAGMAYALWFVGKPGDGWEAVLAADRAASNGPDRFLASHVAALAGSMGITADPANAYSYAARSRALAAPLRNPTADAWSSFAAGGALLVAGDIDQSRVEYTRALELAGRTNNHFVEGLALMMMAIRSVDAGWDDTTELYRRGLTRLQADRAWSHIWTLVGALAHYWIETGHPEHAAVALGALAKYDPIGNSSVADRRLHAQQAIAQHPGASEWVAQGGRLNRDEVVNFALLHLADDAEPPTP